MNVFRVIEEINIFAPNQEILEVIILRAREVQCGYIWPSSFTFTWDSRTYNELFPDKFPKTNTHRVTVRMSVNYKFPFFTSFSHRRVYEGNFSHSMAMLSTCKNAITLVFLWLAKSARVHIDIAKTQYCWS